MGERELWEFFREVRDAVSEGNHGAVTHPYRSGTFLVMAQAGEVELTVKDVTEEDAILIAGELESRGVRALVWGSVLCQACGERVPDQTHCARCRARLAAG
jgi:hypothetical protein